MTQNTRNSAPSKLAPLALGLIFLGIAGFLGWGTWQAVHPEPVPLQGMMDARTVAVSAKIPGRIAGLLVKEGDEVTAGTPVADIAIPELEAKLAQVKAKEAQAQAKKSLADTGARIQEKEAAKADLERAKAGLQLAQKTYTRVNSLYKEGLIAAQRNDEAWAQLQAAGRLVDAAAAKVSAVDEGARTQDKEAAAALVSEAQNGVAEVASLAGEAQVRSPVNGEVTRVVMEAGEVAPAGFPIVLVTDLADSWAVFNIREDELPGIEKGKQFKGRIPALNMTVPLEVFWINPRGDYATWRATRQASGYDLRTFEVRMRPLEKTPALRPGMTVIIER